MLDVERNGRGRWRAAEAAISVAAVAAVGGDTRLAMTLCSRISPTVLRGSPLLPCLLSRKRQ